MDDFYYGHVGRLPVALTLLFTTRSDVREFKHVTPTEAKSLWTLYGVLTIWGFFLVDGADTEDSIGSVFTKIAGSGLTDLSSYISLFLLLLALLLVLLVVKDAIKGRRRLKK